MEYCGADTAGVARLLPAMLAKVDLPRAPLGFEAYTQCLAWELRGTPSLGSSSEQNESGLPPIGDPRTHPPVRVCN